jgi:hypothetical protein
MAVIRTVNIDLMDDIVEYQKEAAEFLKVDLLDSPKKIVEAINSFIRKTKSEDEVLDEDNIIGIGVLLGEQYVRQFEWHWREVNFDEDGLEKHFYSCVLPTNNSVSINPIWWVSNILKTSRPTNILLNFNMVAERKIPNAAANEALGFH